MNMRKKNVFIKKPVSKIDFFSLSLKNIYAIYSSNIILYCLFSQRAKVLAVYPPGNLCASFYHYTK